MHSIGTLTLSLVEAERIFESNATLEEVLTQALALTARVNASTARATETMQSLMPQDLNTTNNILSNTITLLENSVATGLNTTTAETQEVHLYPNLSLLELAVI